MPDMFFHRQLVDHRRKLDLDVFERLLRSEIRVHGERDVYGYALHAVKELRELRAARARAERRALPAVPTKPIARAAAILAASRPARWASSLLSRYSRRRERT